MTRSYYILCAVFLCASIWTAKARANPLSGPVEAISCAPSDPRVAAALARDRIWTTTDGGDSWTLRTAIATLHNEDVDEDENDDLQPESIFENEDEDFAVSPPNFLDNATSREDSREKDDSVAGLAVADDGGFAVIYPDVIAVRRARDRGVIEIPVAGALDARFDPQGRLWILTPTTLQRASGSKLKTVATISNPRHLRRGSSPFHLLAVTRDRVMEVNTRTVDITTQRFASNVLDASRSKDGGLAVLHRGRVIWAGPAEEVRSSIPVPSSTDALLLDGKEAVYTREAGGFWRAEGETTDAVALDLDASGRIWMATSLAVIPPGTEDPPLLGLAPSSSGPTPEPAPYPGPPPCKRLPMSPLPTATVKGGLERERVRARENDQTSDLASGERLFTRAYASIVLTWTFGPPDVAGCVHQREIHARTVEQRRRVLAALTVALEKARARHLAKPSWETALEVERYRKLISIHAKERKE